MPLDLLVRNARPIIPGTPCGVADIGVEGGRIAALGAPGTLPRACRIIDAGGLPALPGLVDAHFHLGYWSAFERECETETMGAAVSGVTTAIVMLKLKNLPPHLRSSPSYLEVFDELVSIVERHSLIDMAFRPYPITPRQVAEIPECVRRLGARGFKFIMHFRPGSLDAEMSGAHALDDGELLGALREVGRAGGIACVHAENQGLIDAASAALERAGRDDLAAWAEGRPPVSEVEAIQRAVLLAGAAGCPLYVVHVSAAESVDLIADAKRRGLRVRAETCPHYLTLSQDDPNGKLAKQKPPIRDLASRERLWSAVRDGVIDCISSDHMPSRRLDREQEPIWSCQWGFPSVETLLPLMLDEGVRRGRLTLERLVELTSASPAAIFGLYPRKGHLGIGADADIVVVDPDLRKTVRSADLPSGSDFSLYEGRELVGWPVVTIIRGRVVARDGRVVEPPGGGRYLPQGEIVLPPGTRAGGPA